ncbi:MAG: hypothetical protein ACI364_04840, partial [Coriobacteriales bacterium]
MSRLDIVIPAYNEAANIAQVVGQWYPVVTSCGDGSLIVLDDGSTENALLATTVAQTAQLGADGHRPIVVLNACESARMSRSFASMGGFASAFLLQPGRNLRDR